MVPVLLVVGAALFGLADDVFGGSGDKGFRGHIGALLSPALDERARVQLLGVRADAATEVARQLGAFDLILNPASDAAAIESYARRISSLSGIGVAA